MKEIKKFTYEDYIKYTKDEIKLGEESEKYKLEKTHQYIDKGIKLVLEDKEEAVHLINKIMKLEDTANKLTEEQLEKYNSSFITPEFRAQESDVVYKEKGKDIFFLIEHQSKVDYAMSYRILNYCIEIIRSAVDKKRLGRKNYQIPVVYPIVLYTGKTRWKSQRKIEEDQIKLKKIEKEGFASYNLLDINDYKEEELWKEKNFLSRVLLLEKAKQQDKINEYLERIEKERLDKKEINILVKMVCASITRKTGNMGEIRQFIEKLNRKGGEQNMLAIEEIIDNMVEEKIEKGMKRSREEGMKQGIEQGMKQGMKQGMRQVIKNMLHFGEKDEKIMKYMGIKKEELEEIKAEL